MGKEYIIYCDESDKRGPYFSNFYGGAIVSSRDLLSVTNILEAKKTELNLFGEVKWSKVTHNYFEKYFELMNCFFALIKENKIKIRIMFTQNRFVAKNLNAYQIEHEYFLLYFQFIKHAFGLQHAGDSGIDTKVRIYLDKLPFDTHAKIAEFKSFLHRLSNYSAFKEAGIILPEDQIAEVDSKHHVILQSLDIVLGAMTFRLNNKHKEKPEGKKRRAKRTVAKEKLYSSINTHIRKIHSGFNIGRSTGLRGEMSNAWHHPYRHWHFIPSEYDIDKTKDKP